MTNSVNNVNFVNMTDEQKAKLIRISGMVAAYLDKKAKGRESYDQTIRRLFGIEKKKLTNK